MIYVFLANGFEDIEAIAPIDILRRAGAKVVTVGVGSRSVVSANGIPVTADISEEQVRLSEALDMVVLPGGGQGTANLAKSKTVLSAVKYCAERDRFIAAICAAPTVLGEAGLLRGKRATCYPGLESKLTGAIPTGESVVRDGNIITAKGAGVALAFGF